jgi:hypothetical protein
MRKNKKARPEWNWSGRRIINQSCPPEQRQPEELNVSLACGHIISTARDIGDHS